MSLRFRLLTWLELACRLIPAKLLPARPGQCLNPVSICFDLHCSRARTGVTKNDMHIFPFSKQNISQTIRFWDIKHSTYVFKNNTNLHDLCDQVQRMTSVSGRCVIPLSWYSGRHRCTLERVLSLDTLWTWLRTAHRILSLLMLSLLAIVTWGYDKPLPLCSAFKNCYKTVFLFTPKASPSQCGIKLTKQMFVLCR